jgi:hypothetical protein
MASVSNKPRQGAFTFYNDLDIRQGEMQSAHTAAAAKPVTPYLLGKPRRRIENNVKMNGGKQTVRITSG